MNQLVVTGYASLDHVLHLGAPLDPGRTTQGRRDPAAWPRAGGCPTYIARAAVAAGQPALPVMWVGDDAAGTRLCGDLARAHVSTDAIARVPGARSPTAVMAYQPGGATACLFDPGLAGQERLTEAQTAAIAAASHLCIAVGPGHLTEQILACRNDAARLYWAIKDDPNCFPPAVCRTLSAHANVIFCSAAERGMIADTRAVIVETHGAKGLHLTGPSLDTRLTAMPLEVADTTGAGDTLIGGFVAAEMAGAAPPDAAKAGIAAADAMLRQRQEGAA